jgi:hypothetical protein
MQPDVLVPSQDFASGRTQFEALKLCSRSCLVKVEAMEEVVEVGEEGAPHIQEPDK